MLVKDIKLIIHERRFFIVLGLLLVLVSIGIIFGTSGIEANKVDVGIVDLDDSDYSRLLVSYFEENEVFTSYIRVHRGTEEQMADLFQTGGLDMYLVIPEDFASRLMVIDNVPIKAVIDSSDVTSSIVYKNLLESYGRYISSVELNCQSLWDIMNTEGYEYSYIDSENYAVSYELIFTALGKDNFFKRVETDRFKGISLINYYVCSGLMLLILYGGMLAGLGHIRDRLSSVNLRIRTIGIGPVKQFLSALLAYGIVSCAFFLASMLLLNCSGKMHFDIGSFFFVVFAVFMTAVFFMLAGRAFSSIGSYMTFSNMLILLLTIVGGGIIPIMYLPEAIVSVARFTPYYWLIKGIL